MYVDVNECMYCIKPAFVQCLVGTMHHWVLMPILTQKRQLLQRFYERLVMPLHSWSGLLLQVSYPLNSYNAIYNIWGYIYINQIHKSAICVGWWIIALWINLIMDISPMYLSMHGYSYLHQCLHYPVSCQCLYMIKCYTRVLYIKITIKYTIF